MSAKTTTKTSRFLCVRGCGKPAACGHVHLCAFHRAEQGVNCPCVKPRPVTKPAAPVTKPPAPSPQPPSDAMHEEIKRLRAENEMLTKSMRERLSQRELELAQGAYAEIEAIQERHAAEVAELSAHIHTAARRQAILDEVAQEQKEVIDAQRATIETHIALKEALERRLQESDPETKPQRDLLERADNLLDNASEDGLDEKTLVAVGKLVEQAGGKNPVPRALKKKKATQRRKQREAHLNELAKPKKR